MSISTKEKNGNNVTFVSVYAAGLYHTEEIPFRKYIIPKVYHTEGKSAAKVNRLRRYILRPERNGYHCKKTASVKMTKAAFCVVPVTGLEPVRYCYHGILSPGRLPIPPHRRLNG